jgi:hypothetical protein
MKTSKEKPFVTATKTLPSSIELWGLKWDINLLQNTIKITNLHQDMFVSQFWRILLLNKKDEKRNSAKRKQSNLIKFHSNWYFDSISG